MLQKEQERLSALRTERDRRDRDNSLGRIVREDRPKGRKHRSDTQSVEINLDNSGRMDIDPAGKGDHVEVVQNRSVILKLRIRTPEINSTSPDKEGNEDAEVDEDKSGRSRSFGGSDENKSRLDKKRKR